MATMYSPAALLQYIIALLALSLLYSGSLVFYRLYLSPLAKQRIPGPKLAAASQWYEFYYDVILRGRYTWKIGEMHEKYGPIVRINPYEVHIKDPDFYDQLYTGPTNPRDKWAWQANQFGNSSSHFGSVTHELHRLRRAPINPFFSKRSVYQLEAVISAKVEQLCQRMHEFRNNKKPLNIRYAFSALAMDIVTEYSFGTSYECIEDPDFAPSWAHAIDAIAEQSHINKQFPWLLPIMQLSPLWLVQRLNPNVMGLIRFREDIFKQVSRLMQCRESGEKLLEDPSIFSKLLQPGALPVEEQTHQHLVDEGQAIVAAAQLTTTFYFNATIYHVLANPDIHAKLKAELKNVMQDGSIPPLRTLEQLPYLSAVILEGLRISYGTSHRLTRISPRAPIQFKEYVLPPDTPVGMTTVFMHDNPAVFPEPRAFNPERWLDPSTRRTLDKSFVAFGRGTRGCIGQHLALAEIHISLAAIFARYDMEIYESTRDDIEAAHDFFAPQARQGSLGLRVIVN